MVDAVLVMTGASFVALIVIVVVWVAHRSGVPLSHTWTASVQDDGGVGPVGVKLNTPVLGTMLPPQVCAGNKVHTTPGPSMSERVALYVYATSSVAVVDGVLVITGASFTALIVIVVVWVAHRSGVPLSHTWTASVQDDGGVGPAGVKLNAPVVGEIVPPQVCAGNKVHTTPGPSMSERVALYVYATSSVAVVDGVLVITGASFTAMPVITLVPVTAAATPSLTLVRMLKLVVKFDAGVNTTPANKVFTFAIAPLAVQTPALNTEVTAPDVAVLSEPAATFDKVNVTVRLGLSISLVTISMRFNATSSV